MDIGRWWNGWSHRRRIAVYLLGLVVIVGGFTGGYVAAMAVFEGRAVSASAAFLVVVESFTTTGYGEQARLWSTAGMRAVMVLMQLTGVAMIFLALPVFVGPYVEERLKTAPPAAVSDASDHVIVAGDLAGSTLRSADLRARTGCTVVAVERNGESLTDLDPDVRLREGDELVVVGTDEDVNRFSGLVA